MSSKSTEIDMFLWQGVVQSDERSFEHLYRKYSSALFSAAVRLLKDREICEDIVQEVFVRLWLKRSEIQVTNIRSYLYQSVKNKTIDLIRNQKINIQLIDIENYISADQTDSLIMKKEAEIALEQSIRELPLRCAEILHLKKEYHLSNKEIAQKLNISLKTVENQITIAIKKLKISLSGRLDLFILAFPHLFYLFV